MRYTDNQIIKGLGVKAYEYHVFKLHNPDKYENLIEQYQIARGKVFAIARYGKLIKRGYR